MKKLLSFFYIGLAALVVFSACSRVDDLPYYDKGKPVTLTADKTAVTLALADSNANVVRFSWTDPKYAQDASDYKYVIEIDSAGRNFSNKTTKVVTGKMSDSLTGRELNAMLVNYGFTLGVPHTLDVRVVSSYGNNNEAYESNVISLIVTPFADPSVLTSTTTTVNGSLAIANQNALTFNWTPSFQGYNGAVTYVLEFDSAGNNFASAQTLTIGSQLYAHPLIISDINAMALNEGIAGGTTGKLDFRLRATTAQGATAYSNVLPITISAYVPFYRMYLVGSINGWDINNPWEIISDKAGSRWGKVFYTYARLSAGDAFVFVKTPGDWNTKHGSTGGSGATHTIGAPGTGGDFVVSASGIYRLTIDLNSNQVFIQQKQVGLVGNMQGWDPANPLY
ncbi:MAG: SusF/SusE family outer membrane protein, partial [Sphingobacteriales bacterium]